MTIATTLGTTLRGALLGGAILTISIISNIAPVTAHETNTIKRDQTCRVVLADKGNHKHLCRTTKHVQISAITIYNRRHCHAGGRCHKHRFANPNHRH